MRLIAFAVMVAALPGCSTSPAGSGDPPATTDPVSGKYSGSFYQTDKSCGTPIAPVDLAANVAVVGDTLLLVTSASDFLGIGQVTLRYDGMNGATSGTLEQVVDLGETHATIQLTLDGSVTPGDQGQIEFNVHLSKTCSDPAWNCTVMGNGIVYKTQ